ncbi:RES domain-containing protein [Paenibacillus validus]|uniref:RES domain-containing protein n=1 Tax=Paenibacillus validus TaxID=44253 RepID=UPI0039B6EE11
MDPSASDYEYVPTQYLAELIKTLGYDGFIFKSSVGPDNNLVFFDQTKLKAINSRLYQVSSISYEFEELKNF